MLGSRRWTPGSAQAWSSSCGAVQALCWLPMPTRAEIQSARNTQRWLRFCCRLEARSLWHWGGLRLWLIQRPGLRKYPLPWPGTSTERAYEEQTGIKLSAIILNDLVYLRDKLGLRLAFLENEQVSAALAMFRKKKKGERDMLRMRAAKQAQAFAGGLRPSTGPGSRGGLPKTKGELMVLAELMGIDFTGKTVPQLKEAIKLQQQLGTRPSAAKSSTSPQRASPPPAQPKSWPTPPRRQPPVASPAASPGGGGSQDETGSQDEEDVDYDPEMMETSSHGSARLPLRRNSMELYSMIQAAVAAAMAAQAQASGSGQPAHAHGPPTDASWSMAGGTADAS